jgi:Lon protease-like protein
LAIFPLDLVLLPGTPLPLHIFEDRYREMIAECLETKQAFGMVRAKEDNSVEEIGCSAEILEVSKRYTDGRMDIVTRGRERFEIMRVDQERAFLRAEVVYLPDEPGRARLEDISRALQLQAEILELAGEEVDASVFAENPQLSFQIAGSLPLDLDFKQTLLGVNSESERMQTVVAYLETILPNLRRTLHVRKKAGGNGHGI